MPPHSHYIQPPCEKDSIFWRCRGIIRLVPEHLLIYAHASLEELHSEKCKDSALPLCVSRSASREGAQQHPPLRPVISRFAGDHSRRGVNGNTRLSQSQLLSHATSETIATASASQGEPCCRRNQEKADEAASGEVMGQKSAVQATGLQIRRKQKDGTQMNPN